MEPKYEDEACMLPSDDILEIKLEENSNVVFKDENEDADAGSAEAYALLSNLQPDTGDGDMGPFKQAKICIVSYLQNSGYFITRNNAIELAQFYDMPGSTYLKVNLGTKNVSVNFVSDRKTGNIWVRISGTCGSSKNMYLKSFLFRNQDFPIDSLAKCYQILQQMEETFHDFLNSLARNEAPSTTTI